MPQTPPTEFKPTWLYVKRCAHCGLLYFGKTIRDPFTYPGSGIVWTRHIRKHGVENVETLAVRLFKSFAKCQRHALRFSRKHDIANSKKWANLQEEDGYNGGLPSKATKRRMSRAAKGRPAWNKGMTTGRPAPNAGIPHSEETRRILSRKAKKWLKRDGHPFKGKRHSEETRTKIRAAIEGKCGHPHSDASKEKLRIANTGKKLSGATKAKISANNKAGTSEVRQKMRDAHLGVPLSDTHRRNIGLAHLGMKRSEEAIQNMSRAQQKLIASGRGCKGKSWKLVGGKRVWVNKEN